MQPGYQLTGPLGTALSMGTSASQQQPGGFFKETVHEVRHHILCLSVGVGVVRWNCKNEYMTFQWIVRHFAVHVAGGVRPHGHLDCTKGADQCAKGNSHCANGNSHWAKRNRQENPSSLEQAEAWHV